MGIMICWKADFSSIQFLFYSFWSRKIFNMLIYSFRMNTFMHADSAWHSFLGHRGSSYKYAITAIWIYDMDEIPQIQHFWDSSSFESAEWNLERRGTFKITELASFIQPMPMSLYPLYSISLTGTDIIRMGNFHKCETINIIFYSWRHCNETALHYYTHCNCNCHSNGKATVAVTVTVSSTAGKYLPAQHRSCI